jgi:DNA-binding transcriptional regulator/RsmH inhibitor MraZ
MGTVGQSTGNGGRARYVRLFGYQDLLSLDARGRFRLPDELAGALQRELGRLQAAGAADVPPTAFQRLSFYFVPGTRQRIFLYPTPNISLALESFENPPRDMDPELVRQARDYFYARMRFSETDRQNRLVIPEALCAHAGIDEQVQQIAVVAQNYWLALMRGELLERRAAESLEAFEQAAPDLLDPVRRAPSDAGPQAGPPS